MYSVAGSLPPQVTHDPRGFSLNCLVPESLVAGLQPATMEVQMITSAQIEIKTEASNGPQHKTLKITGGLINVCSAYILMMKRYLDVEKAAGLAVQSPQNPPVMPSSSNAGETDALSKALNWMTEFQSPSTEPAAMPGPSTTPAIMNASLTAPSATPGLGTMPALSMAWPGTAAALGTMPALSAETGLGTMPGVAMGLPALQTPSGQTSAAPAGLGPAALGLLGGLQDQLQPPLPPAWQQPVQQPQQTHQLQQLQQQQQQLPTLQGAHGTAEAVALSQHATTLMQQTLQGQASNDPKVKEMAQLQEHLNALQAQVAAQNSRQ